MRLYAICKTDKRPFYIASHVRVRSKLPSSFFLTCPYGHTNPYTPQDIFVETT